MATLAEGLTRTWETPENLIGWLTTVDHKQIGIRYIITAYVFFALAGVSALLMRAQLAAPQNRLLGPEIYNQLFTLHGTTMIFFFSTPILFGFGNFLVPLMIGARDMAFPRLNAFGYWVFLFAGLFLYSSLIVGAVPDAGWFNYPPLSSRQFDPGINIGYYALSLLFLGIATTAGAINFIVTIFKLRAPGMSLNRLPLFCWSILVTSFAVVLAIPPLNTANLMLELDRRFGAHFFDPAGGGSVLLWQHLFWTFGHPDVYIIFLPAVGMVSSIIPVFTRRPLVGYTYVVIATVATGIISFGVWVHHMFAVGLPQLSLSFFAAASTVIAIPSGIQFAAWLTTIWRGRVVWRTPFYFILAFLITFVIGGVTGVMFALPPFDQQVTDSYFVVAHFHYVLFGGAVFPIFGAVYYWFPKMTGKLMNERLGLLNVALMFIGFNVTFFPMHLLGLWGMPRRVFSYPVGMGWGTTNLIETIGAFVLAAGILVFVINVLWSLERGETSGDDPWGGNTLEWFIPSPPPAYNFAAIPVVRSADPVWDERDLNEEIAEEPPPLTAGRETLGTTVLDAQIEEVLPMPGSSPWPLAVAIGLAVLFTGLLAGSWPIFVIGLVIGTTSLVAWMWPRPEEAAA